MEHNSSRDIIFAIRQICGVDGMKDARFMTANVDEVQEADRTISCTIILGESDLKLTEVGLQSEAADGFILIPKIDTDVLICLMPDNSAYVILCNDIDKVICVIDEENSYIFDSNGFILNGGANGGLMKIIDYTTKQNALIAELQAQLTLIATGISGAGGTYTPGTLTQFNKTDYEDLKVKH